MTRHNMYKALYILYRFEYSSTDCLTTKLSSKNCGKEIPQLPIIIFGYSCQIRIFYIHFSASRQEQWYMYSTQFVEMNTFVQGPIYVYLFRGCPYKVRTKSVFSSSDSRDWDCNYPWQQGISVSLVPLLLKKTPRTNHSISFRTEWGNSA
jgi:hypothetical protein